MPGTHYNEMLPLAPVENFMRFLLPGLLYFVLVFGTGFLLGMIRVPLLVPQMGKRWAELLEAPFMFLAIYCWARYIVNRFTMPAGWRHRIPAGLVGLLLLLMAEIMLTMAMQNLSLNQALAAFIGGRDPVSGSVYFLLLGIFALMPWLVSSREGIRPAA